MSFWKIVAILFWLVTALAIAFAAYARTWDALALHGLAAAGFSGIAGWAERMVASLDRAIETEETFR